MGKYLVSYRDWGMPGEVSTMTIPIVDITDANIVTQSALCDTLRTSINAITLGGLDQRQLVAWVNDTKTDPDTQYAQRENKWLCRYHKVSDDERHTLEIPCADLAYLDPNANDKLDMTHADVIAFKAAFEAVVSVGGSAVVLDEVLFVTRRS